MTANLDRQRFLFWAAWTLGLVLNLSIAAILPGTSDVQCFGAFGEQVAKHGLAQAYAADPIYNVPPLAAALSAIPASYAGAGTLAFGFLFRLPGILALAALSIVLRRRAQTFSAAVLALNPLSLAIAGYHGNLDPLLAVCVGAALLAAADERPAMCGVWLGLAANLKISPVFVGPAFLLWWMPRGGALRFATACGLVVLAGWSPALILCPKLFLQNVLSYGSVWGQWGISRLLYLTGDESFHRVGYGTPGPIAATIATLLKLTLIMVACALAWWRRRVPAQGLFATVAATWVLFLVLAPGGAPQYLIWPLVPLVFVSGRAGLVYSLVALPMLALYYTPLTMFLVWVNPRTVLGTLVPPLGELDGWTWAGLALWAFLAVALVAWLWTEFVGRGRAGWIAKLPIAS